MLYKSLLFIVLTYPLSLLQSQTSTSTIDNFSIADCVSTPCQDIIVEGGNSGLSFRYIDCNCSTVGVFVPPGKVFVLKALVGKIDVAQGAFNPTGVISQPVSNTLYVEALEELMQTSFGSIHNSILTLGETICNGTQPQEIIGGEGKFFDFDVSYAWLKSDDNVNFNYIPGANSKNYIPEPVQTTKYFKRQLYTAVSTGTFSDVYTLYVTQCTTTTCQINEEELNLPDDLTASTYIITETIDFSAQGRNIGRVFSSTNCNQDLAQSERLAYSVSGLPDGLTVEWSYPRLYNGIPVWEWILSGAATPTSAGTYTISLTIDNSYVGGVGESPRDPTISLTTSFTIIVKEAPVIPTQTKPQFFSSVFSMGQLKDHIGEIFNGFIKSITSSSTIEEGVKYYNIKHQQNDEN